MGYEAKEGVLTEEDKVRMVLANTGHEVDVAEVLQKAFDATPRHTEEEQKEFDENPNATLEEPSEDLKAALASQEAEMAKNTETEHKAEPESESKAPSEPEGETHETDNTTKVL